MRTHTQITLLCCVVCVVRQGWWPSVFVKVLLGHRWLVSALTHRLWDLLQHQVSERAAVVCGICVCRGTLSAPAVCFRAVL